MYGAGGSEALFPYIGNIMSFIVVRWCKDNNLIKKTYERDKYKYTAWYLFNMAIADYRVSLPNDEVRACFVWETIKDPDGCPANVLDCFVTKMCNAGEIICWEEML